LDGGSLNIDRTLVGEAYVRFALLDHLALTLDLHYMDDHFVDGAGPRGFIYGARLVATF
jgi:hypothetical protein